MVYFHLIGALCHTKGAGGRIGRMLPCFRDWLKRQEGEMSVAGFSNYLTVRTFVPLPLLLGVCLVFACDPEGKNDCAWVLEPEPTLQHKAEPGLIAVCARNRQTMKQDCRLQTSVERAKAYYGKTFRYSDLETMSVALPRTIRSLRFCKTTAAR